MNLAQTNIFTKTLDFLVPIGPLLLKIENCKPFKGWQKLVLHVIPFTFFIFWLFSFIPLVGEALYLLVLVPLSAKRHIALKVSTDPHSVYLWYLTIVAIGFVSFRGFIGHMFMSDSIAGQIGWATGSPFQTELAFYSLGIGIAGLLTVWIKGQMITGLVITKVIFWYGAAYVHIEDAIVNQNYSSLNIGTPLVNDILLPTVFLIFLFCTLKSDTFSKKI